MSNDNTIRLTIDGRAVEATKGETVLQVCDREGIEVPRYCYHPGLSISGNCRICMVEVEGMPHTQVSCYLQAQDGMEVKTQSEAARKARQDVLEFLLVNHPVDCPVCDQSGECMLQDYYMEHGRYESRLNDDKVRKRKTVVLGPHVMLDTERCILCSRCVRFTDEISETHELGIWNRNDQAEINTAPGVDLDNNYSSCTVDVCPVGALTERDFRFQMRVWYLKRDATVCPHCSRGCNIEVHHNEDKPWKAGGRRLLRIKPRVNPKVNQWWMCDIGRFSNDWVDAPSRLRRPQVLQGEGHHDVGWETAVEETMTTLRASLEDHGPDGVGVLLSPWMTVEEMHLAHRVFGEALGVRHIGCRLPGDGEGEGDGFLMTGDRNPNAGGADALGLEEGDLLGGLEKGRIQTLVAWRRDPAEVGIDLDAVETILYAGTNANALSARARVVLPVAAWVERSGSFVNVDGRLQTFAAALPPAGEARADFRVLLELGSASGVAFSYDSPADVMRELAEEGGPFAGADLDEARDLGEPWHINGIGRPESTIAGTALADEEG